MDYLNMYMVVSFVFGFSVSFFSTGSFQAYFESKTQVKLKLIELEQEKLKLLQ